MTNYFLKLLTVILLFSANISMADPVKLQSINTILTANNSLQVNLKFSQALTQAQMPKSFDMLEQNKVIFDFANTQVPTSIGNIVVNKAGVNSIFAIGKNDDENNRTRVIVDLKNQATYKVTVDDQDASILHITFSGAQNAANNANPGLVDTITGNTTTSNAKTSSTPFTITNIDFSQDKNDSNGGGQITVTLNQPGVETDIEDLGQGISIKFGNTVLANPGLQKKYDVTDFKTPVNNYALGAVNNAVNLIVNVDGAYSQSAYQIKNKLYIDISPQTINPLGGFDDKPHYQGEKISLNFQDISIRSILQLLAEFTGKNIVISDEVKGNLTLRLQNVPWDQALDFILQTEGLGQRSVGNVLMIAPMATITAQEQADAKAKLALAAVAPLYTQSFQINYGTADPYYNLLKDPNQSILSPRGKVAELSTNNTLIVEDTADKLQAVATLLKQMDKPARQVLVEARIVYVNTSYEKRLGVLWGSQSQASGTVASSTNLLPTTTRFTGFQDLNMDFGAGNLTTGGLSNTAPGALALGTSIGGVFLDLELQAIEAEGQGELVSSPRVMTSNNQAALIQQGQQIPYTVTAPNGGTSIQLVNAVLELQVTPQITPNNKLILNLNVTQNRPESLTGNPIIDTRQITTNILVNNGQTIVLGGVYERNATNILIRVPFLSDIPFLGALFKSQSNTDVKTELLVFVTPKIIETSDDKNS